MVAVVDGLSDPQDTLEKAGESFRRFVEEREAELTDPRFLAAFPRSEQLELYRLKRDGCLHLWIRVPVKTLPARELGVARLVAKGLETKEIARELKLHPDTIAEDLRRSFLRLGIHSRAALAARALFLECEDAHSEKKRSRAAMSPGVEGSRELRGEEEG